LRAHQERDCGSWSPSVRSHQRFPACGKGHRRTRAEGHSMTCLQANASNDELFVRAVNRAELRGRQFAAETFEPEGPHSLCMCPSLPSAPNTRGAGVSNVTFGTTRHGGGRRTMRSSQRWEVVVRHYETLESGVPDADTQSCDDAARNAPRRTLEGSGAESAWEQSSSDVQHPTSSSRFSPGS